MLAFEASVLHFITCVTCILFSEETKAKKLKGKDDVKEASKPVVSKPTTDSSVKSQASSSKSSDNGDTSKESTKVEKPVKKDLW